MIKSKPQTTDRSSASTLEVATLELMTSDPMTSDPMTSDPMASDLKTQRDFDHFNTLDAMDTTSDLLNSRFTQCESVMVCLEGGRFAIVHHDDFDTLQSTECPVDDLRKLRVDELVRYRDHPSRVLAIEPYR